MFSLDSITDSRVYKSEMLLQYYITHGKHIKIGYILCNGGNVTLKKP